MRRRNTSGSKTVRVWEVVADTDGEGPAGDGTVVFRFGSEHEAEAFAARSTCYGRPAIAHATDAPKHVAARWGFA
jgi:hypothetical protein